MMCKSEPGFSFIEVMVAMAILSISLVALLGSQSTSMDLVSRARSLDTAVTLATEKMVEISQTATQKGVTSLKDDETGDFDQDKYPTYKWHYRLKEVPAPNFGALMGDDSGKSNNASLLAGPLAAISKVWGQALKELHVEVSWKDGAREKSYELVTHLVSPDGVTQLSSLVTGLTGGAAASPNTGASSPTGARQ